ncbi:ferritin [Bacteroidales bacterium OttesenSCG-928-B11]|nr:ferritin [Bacteroidales bacterium OttesenSCG-928-B11]
MGQVTREIAKLDVDKLLEMLNAALSEEWLAYYQYWIGARVVEGKMRSAVEAELLEHANEELEHAEMIAERIIQLGGTPVLSPDEWSKLAHCKYARPDDTYVTAILNDNLGGERCAIKRYQEIAEFTFGKDYITHKMALSILEDELEHEQEIEDWLNDIEVSIDHRGR